jgi:hypothetical protein
VECEPRGVQGWAAIIREGTPHGRTGAPHDFSFRIMPSCEAPFHGAYPADTLFACFLGMAVGVIHRLRCLAEIMEVTQLVWPIGEHFRDGTAEGELAVRHDADHRPRHVLTHAPEQDGEVRGGRRPQTAGQEDFPGEAVSQDPQHLMADVRLEAIEGQNAPALGLGKALQTGGIGEGEGEQCVVALEQMHDGPWGNGHPTGTPVLMDCGQTTVLRVAQGPDVRHDIEAKLMLG